MNCLSQAEGGLASGAAQCLQFPICSLPQPSEAQWLLSLWKGTSPPLWAMWEAGPGTLYTPAWAAGEGHMLGLRTTVVMGTWQCPGPVPGQGGPCTLHGSAGAGRSFLDQSVK